MFNNSNMEKDVHIRRLKNEETITHKYGVINLNLFGVSMRCDW